MKKDYLKPEFEMISVTIANHLLASEPEAPIHENDPGEKPIED